jgi:hypothetical protein
MYLAVVQSKISEVFHVEQLNYDSLRARGMFNPTPQLVQGDDGIWRYKKDANLAEYFAKLKKPERSPLEIAIRQAIHVAGRNAKTRNLEFSLTPEDILKIAARHGNVCAVSGLEFDLSGAKNNVRRPYFPSIDRIDNAKGYVRGNVRVVCVAVNVAMNVWGESVLRKIAESMVRR